MTAILELRNVDAAYGSTQILQAVDLAVEERGITTLLGANGAGKTTTLRASAT
jgi:branched-chain amino acid transport system ATP-binding protein